MRKSVVGREETLQKPTRRVKIPVPPRIFFSGHSSKWALTHLKKTEARQEENQKLQGRGLLKLGICGSLPSDPFNQEGSSHPLPSPPRSEGKSGRLAHRNQEVGQVTLTLPVPVFSSVKQRFGDNSELTGEGEEKWPDGQWETWELDRSSASRLCSCSGWGREPGLCRAQGEVDVRT